ncbi:MAG: hypothetical protein IT426_21170 [Pirellulales bacterium]|nr:hypothetical protein [Pirellulales bacterium]
MATTTWKKLLETHRVETHVTSKQEIDDLRSAVARNLRDSAIDALSADNRFGLAYEAALLLSKMVLACAGYRVKGQGSHQTSFLALPLVLGDSSKKTSSYFDRCRRKRNAISYDTANVVTDTEVKEILAKAKGFQQTVETWIAKTHPEVLSSASKRKKSS